MTFTATLTDGTIETRTSKTKTYTHVLVSTATAAAAQFDCAEGETGVWSWHSSAALAAKAMDSARRQCPTSYVFQVQPVD